jgi:hypothetical protein
MATLSAHRFAFALALAAATVLLPTSLAAQDTQVIPSKRPKMVHIVKTDGTDIAVFRGGFGFCNGSTEGVGLDLGNGQSVDYGRIKTIDVLGFQNHKARLRITLNNTKSIEFASQCDANYGPGGQNDLGEVNVPFRQVKQVIFPR